MGSNRSCADAALVRKGGTKHRLQVAATNQGDATVNPQRHRLSFFLDGRPCTVADMAFGNGAMEHAWLALAPGETVRDERALGEALFNAPGEYDVGMRYLDVEVANLHVRVTGPATPT